MAAKIFEQLEVDTFTVTTSLITTGATTSIEDSNFNILNQADNTKTLNFDISGASTSSEITIVSSHTGNRTITLFDSTDTVVGRNTTDTLTNKTLTAPIISSISNTGTLTLPTSTDTLVGRATTDTLTNKTISDASNTVGANEIRTTGASVVVDTAAPPESRQSLTATSATAASWQYANNRDAVRVATTAAGTLASDFENGDTIDGIILSTNDRILIKDQVSATENGIYTVNASGAPTRAADFASGASVASVFVFVQEGTTNSDAGFVCTSVSGSDVVGTNNLTFMQFTDSSGGGGETNTASNVGTAGVGVFKQKAGVDLEFKNINTANSGNITITDDTGNDEIDIDIGTNVVTLTGAQTLTNKTLTSAVLTTPEINDTSQDHQYIFGVSELAADRTVTLPLLGSNDTFVFEAHTQTLTNKTLTAPVISSISNTGTLTLPTSTDTLVGRATTDTLTNKNISDASNTVGANEIRTTGASVVVDTAAPPSIDQILRATSATAASWQDLPVFGENFTNGSSDSVSTTTNGSFQQKLRVTTGSLPSGGNYYIGYSFEIGVDVKEKPGEYRVQIDDSTTILGPSLFDTFDNVFHSYAGFWVGALTSGTHNIDIDYASQEGETVSIKNARIVFWRVS